MGFSMASHELFMTLAGLCYGFGREEAGLNYPNTYSQEQVFLIDNIVFEN
jgi:hypothetical protein